MTWGTESVLHTRPCTLDYISDWMQHRYDEGQYTTYITHSLPKPRNTLLRTVAHQAQLQENRQHDIQVMLYTSLIPWPKATKLHLCSVCSLHSRKLLLHLPFFLLLWRSSNKTVSRSWVQSLDTRSSWYDFMKPTSSSSGISSPSASMVPRSWSTSLKPYQTQWRYDMWCYAITEV